MNTDSSWTLHLSGLPLHNNNTLWSKVSEPSVFQFRVTKKFFITNVQLYNYKSIKISSNFIYVKMDKNNYTNNLLKINVYPRGNIKVIRWDLIRDISVTECLPFIRLLVPLFSFIFMSCYGNQRSYKFL